MVGKQENKADVFAEALSKPSVVEDYVLTSSPPFPTPSPLPLLSSLFFLFSGLFMKQNTSMV